MATCKDKGKPSRQHFSRDWSPRANWVKIVVGRTFLIFSTRGSVVSTFRATESRVRNTRAARLIKLVLSIIDPWNNLIKKFSTWRKLLRTVAWFKRFVEYLKSKRSAAGGRFLTVQDLKSAEGILIQRA